LRVSSAAHSSPRRVFKLGSVQFGQSEKSVGLTASLCIMPSSRGPQA
jgi:hypothetical protein